MSIKKYYTLTQTDWDYKLPVAMTLMHSNNVGLGADIL